MPASKKSSNTSKTAHVMNLLSKNRDRQPAPSTDEPTSQEKQEKQEKKQAAPASSLPPVMTSLSQDAAVSAQIKSALETSLEKELEAEAPAPVPQPEQPAPLQAPAAVEEASSAEKPPVEEPNTPPSEADVPEASQDQETLPEEPPQPEENFSADESRADALEAELAKALLGQEEMPPEEPAQPEEQPPVSEAHMDALEAELAKALLDQEDPSEEKPSQPQEQPLPETPAGTLDTETLPAEEEPAQPEETPKAEEAPSSDTSVEEEISKALEKSQEEPSEPALVCLNVMEALVEEKADRYIEMFGLCNCPRCSMEVRALALTSLPALYVVVPPHEVNFRLAIYEPRYSAAIIAQLVHACKVVMENPRHDNNNK